MVEIRGVKKKSSQHIKYRYKKQFKAFSANLTRIRKAKGLTQTDLAEAANVNYRTVNFAESGDVNVSLGLIIALAEALEVDPAELIKF